jgi:hypothetical protein
MGWPTVCPAASPTGDHHAAGVAGFRLGGAIFAQSRERSEEQGRMWVRPRRAITLARSAGVSFPPPIDLDDFPKPTCSQPTAECGQIIEAP